MMRCLDCGQSLIHNIEKALDGETQIVNTSMLTGNWVCAGTGNEHRAGTASQYLERVEPTVRQALEWVEDGTHDAAQALRVIAIDLGFMERPDLGDALADAAEQASED